MAARERTRQQYLEHPEQARRPEPVHRAGAETAEIAADNTRAAQSALDESCPSSKSFLHVGDVVVRRQDTSRERVQVVEPFVGDLRVAQVFNPRNLLPNTFGEDCALQTPECRESQPWNEITHLLECAERGPDHKANAP